MTRKWIAALAAGAAAIAFAADLPPDEMVRKTVDEVLAVI